MARLSKRAWNNVVIFCMLGMILVLNSSKLFSPEVDKVQALIGDGEIILALQFNQTLVERVGQTWRISPNSLTDNINVDAASLATFVANWQQAMIEQQQQFDASALANPDHVLGIWLAGEKEARVYAIKSLEGRGYIAANGEVMRIKSPGYALLSEFPSTANTP